MTATPTTTKAPQAQTQKRKYIDCREYPSEKNCSLRISGSEDEVLHAARQHAISAHGHADSPDLSDGLRRSMKDET